jgi:putative acetyltransferase
MHIRQFRSGDELALHDVFYSAVHDVASRDYTAEQIEAWAPASFDSEQWIDRMRAIRPFVVEDGDRIVAYADLQPTGYIDHFFVSARVARRGVGALLMNRILDVAKTRRLHTLTADVSRTALPFFRRFGFVAVEEHARVVRGVVVPNTSMKKDLDSE